MQKFRQLKNNVVNSKRDSQKLSQQQAKQAITEFVVKELSYYGITPSNYKIPYLPRHAIPSEETSKTLVKHSFNSQKQVKRTEEQRNMFKKGSHNTSNVFQSKKCQSDLITTEERQLHSASQQENSKITNTQAIKNVQSHQDQSIKGSIVEKEKNISKDNSIKFNTSSQQNTAGKTKKIQSHNSWSTTELFNMVENVESDSNLANLGIFANGIRTQRRKTDNLSKDLNCEQSLYLGSDGKQCRKPTLDYYTVILQLTAELNFSRINREKENQKSLLQQIKHLIGFIERQEEEKPQNKQRKINPCNLQFQSESSQRSIKHKILAISPKRLKTTDQKQESQSNSANSRTFNSQFDNEDNFDEENDIDSITKLQKTHQQTKRDFSQQFQDNIDCCSVDSQYSPLSKISEHESEYTNSVKAGFSLQNSPKKISQGNSVVKCRTGFLQDLQWIGCSGTQSEHENIKHEPMSTQNSPATLQTPPTKILDRDSLQLKKVLYMLETETNYGQNTHCRQQSAIKRLFSNSGSMKSNSLPGSAGCFDEQSDPSFGKEVYQSLRRIPPNFGSFQASDSQSLSQISKNSSLSSQEAPLREKTNKFPLLVKKKSKFDNNPKEKQSKQNNIGIMQSLQNLFQKEILSDNVSLNCQRNFQTENNSQNCQSITSEEALNGNKKEFKLIVKKKQRPNVKQFQTTKRSDKANQHLNAFLSDSESSVSLALGSEESKQIEKTQKTNTQLSISKKIRAGLDNLKNLSTSQEEEELSQFEESVSAAGSSNKENFQHHIPQRKTTDHIGEEKDYSDAGPQILSVSKSGGISSRSVKYSVLDANQIEKNNEQKRLNSSRSVTSRSFGKRGSKEHQYQKKVIKSKVIQKGTDNSDKRRVLNDVMNLLREREGSQFQQMT